MTHAERLLVESTIKRLELLVPIAKNKGSVLVSGDTLAEALSSLVVLHTELKQREEHEKALREAWKTWRMSVHDFPSRDWAQVFENVRKLMED